MRKACVAGSILAFVVGCGSAPEPKPSRPMATAPATEREANQAPVVERVLLSPPHPLAGDRVQALVTAMDPDGDPYRVSYAWFLNGTPLAETGQTLLVPTVRKGDRLEVEVVVTDGRAESTPGRVSARAGNRPPSLREVRLAPDAPVLVGTRIEARPDALDPDGDSLRFRYAWLVNGRPVETEGDALDGATLHRGDRVAVRVVASDGDDESAAVLSGELEIANSPPEIVSRPGGLGSDGVFRYAVEASDPDGDRNLRFELLEAPRGMTVDPVAGQIAWQPEAAQAGKHAVEVAVLDGLGGASAQRFELTVTAEAPAAAEPPPAAPEP
jgi:hypothetical protein